MRTRQSYFLYDKIESSNEMEVAWSWATAEEKASIRENVRATTKSDMSESYRWFFQLLPRNPKQKRHEPKDRLLTCIPGLPPTNRGMKRDDILKLVRAKPSWNEMKKSLGFISKRKKKVVNLLPTTKKRKRKSVNFW